jgi:hypothetical protein
LESPLDAQRAEVFIAEFADDRRAVRGGTGEQPVRVISLTDERRSVTPEHQAIRRSGRRVG